MWEVLALQPSQDNNKQVRYLYPMGILTKVSLGRGGLNKQEDKEDKIIQKDSG